MSQKTFEYHSISKYSWFLPQKKIVKKFVHDLVQEHQERLKPFGCSRISPCQLLKIWPGEPAGSIIQKKTQAKNSLLQIFIDNCLQILRILNLEAGKLQKLDIFLREKENLLRDIIKNAAIDAADLNIRATTTIPKLSYKNTFITESDIVDVAVEEAVKISLWHLCWLVSERELDLLKKYRNPFSPLMEIFSLGLWPLGISQKDYIVLVPRDTEIVEEVF